MLTSEQPHAISALCRIIHRMKPLNLSYTEQLHTEFNVILLTVTKMWADKIQCATDSLSVEFSYIIQGDSRVIHILVEEDLLRICD